MVVTTASAVAGLAGGALIGLGATLLLLTHGRVAGIAGIWAGLFRSEEPGAVVHRVWFVAGLVGAGLVARWLAPGAFDAAPSVALPVVAAAGLLVGYGTRLGNGCTSGHGVCGMSRVSVRSIVATLTFMLVGAASTYVVRHVWHAPKASSASAVTQPGRAT